MAKKLHQIGFNHIKHYISKNKDLINRYINNSDKHQLAKQFGKSYYEIAIKDFFDKQKIYKNPKYALQTLNIFKSKQFIQELSVYLDLAMFKDKESQTSIFYSFVYFLYDNINPDKKDIQLKLFHHYFLHHISTINTQTPTNLNYKNMTLAYIKGKDITIKESYKIDEDTQNVNFKILLNGKAKIDLDGKSVKTLRKKAYKLIFFYLLDHKEDTEIKNTKSYKEIMYDIHNGL